MASEQLLLQNVKLPVKSSSLLPLHEYRQLNILMLPLCNVFVCVCSHKTNSFSCQCWLRGLLQFCSVALRCEEMLNVRWKVTKQTQKNKQKEKKQRHTWKNGGSTIMKEGKGTFVQCSEILSVCIISSFSFAQLLSC